MTVRGPESRVNALQKVFTESIWLPGHKQTFSANLGIDLPDTKVDLVDPVVNVEVEIGERPIEKSFSAVPVFDDAGVRIQGSLMEITVSGPPTILDALKPEDLKIVLGPQGESRSAMEPRLRLGPELQGKVTLKSTKYVPER